MSKKGGGHAPRNGSRCETEKGEVPLCETANEALCENMMMTMMVCRRIYRCVIVKLASSAGAKLVLCRATERYHGRVEAEAEFLRGAFSRVDQEIVLADWGDGEDC